MGWGFPCPGPCITLFPLLFSRACMFTSWATWPCHLLFPAKCHSILPPSLWVPSTTSGQQHFSPGGRTEQHEKPSHACSLWLRQRLVPITEEAVGQLEAATTCHSWLFARPLQVLSMGLLWAAARTCPVLAKWGACFWACLWSSSSLVPSLGVIVTKGW